MANRPTAGGIVFSWLLAAAVLFITYIIFILLFSIQSN